MRTSRERTASPVCLLTSTEASDPGAARAREDTPTVQLLEAGETLWNEGDRAEHLGIVVTGRLAARRHRGGTPLICDLLQPLDVIGAQSPDGQYHFEVVTLRRSLLLLLPNRTFRRQVGARPAMAVKLLDRYSETISRMAARLETLSSGDVAHRLAQVMLELTERFGEPFDGGVLVGLNLGREQLASMAATTRESVSRRLGEWHKQGILSVQPIGYLVRDLPALRQAAGG